MYTNNKPELRYEIKVPLQAIQYQDLEAYFNSISVVPVKVFNDRQVHSIYLDDMDLTHYKDNVQGLSKRQKTRIRWYDEVISEMRIEVKSKKNKISSKNILSVDNYSSIIPTSKNLLDSLISNHSDLLPYMFAQSLYPMIKVSYHRSYYQFNNGIRMTIDSKIKYRRLYPILTSDYFPSYVDYVLEFKYPVGFENDFKNMLINFPFRIFRHSKYVIGIDTVFPY